MEETSDYEDIAYSYKKNPSNLEMYNDMKLTWNSTSQKQSLKNLLQNIFLDECCLMELFVIMELFHICAVKCGSHWPQVATEYLKCD